MKRTFLKAIHGLRFVFEVTAYYFLLPLAFLIYKRKHIWLIAETDFDARDNGYHFFKYLNENHSEINSIYLIDKSNPNYEAVYKIGKTLKPKSFKHFLIFLASDTKISSAVFGCSPSSYITKHLLKHHGTGKNIALKHGIFKNIHPNYFESNAHLDMICCGAKPEYDFVLKNFGYSSSAIKYTGLARFDALHGCELRNEIFVMPTWRRWLDGKDDAEFKNSDYYSNWISFLKSDNLKSILEKNGFELTFYIHPKLNKHMNLYKTDNDRIHFLNSKSGDSVQAHLKSAKVLITDFSSVFFDFAYMGKSSIYFQFDENEYYKQHYQKGYFDYRTDGFGPVVTDAQALLNELSLCLSNNCCSIEIYKKRMDYFFPLNDDKNCERIFNSIVEVLNK